VRLSRLFTPTRFLVVAIATMAALLATLLVTSPESASADAAGGAQFVSATGRILDTRDGTGGYKTAMPANTWRTVQVTGNAGIPSSSAVTAVALNLTEVSPSGLGQIMARPNADTASTLVGTFDGGNLGITSNQADVAVNSDGTIQVQVNASTQLVIDVEGYYSTTASASGGYVPIAGKRYIQDQTIAAGGNFTIQVTGANGIPSNATAVVADFIVKNQGTTQGYISPGPAGANPPVTSLNYPGVANVATATSAHVSLSSDGKLEVWNRVGTAIKLNIDIEGYFVQGSSTAGSFTAGAARAYDTRVKPHTSVAAGKTLTVPLGGTHGIPNAYQGLSSVVIDLTALHASNDTSGFARAWADGTVEPGISAVEYAPNSIRSNTNTVPVGLDGAIQIHNLSNTTVDFVIDIEGWYAGASSTLCNHDDITLSNIATTGASDGVPTLSAAATNGLGQSVNTALYLLDANGKAVGATPAATGTIDSGTSAIFHPTGLIAGATYTWWVHGSTADACAAQATSAKQTFTMGQDTATALPGTMVRLTGSDLGVQTGPTGGSFAPGSLTAGTDGSTQWVSTMKVNFSALPAGSRIITAVLHGGTATCLTGSSCSSGAASLTPVNSDVSSLSKPDNAAAIPVTSDAVPLSGSGGDTDLTGLVQSWYGAGSVSNNGAILSAASSAAGFHLDPTASLDITYAAPTVPTAPTLLRTTSGDGGLLVSWAAPGDTGYLDQTGATDGTTGYSVTATPSSSGSTVTTTTTGNSVVLTGLSNAISYQIAVAAKNPIGTGPAATAVGAPTAVPGGPAAYTSEVQKLTSAQTLLASGASQSTADAAQGDAVVRDALGVDGGQLITQSDVADLNDQQVTAAVPVLSSTLVSYDPATSAATVFTTVTDQSSTVDASDPNNPVTVPTKSTSALAVTLTAGSTPTVLRTADTAAISAPIAPSSSDTLTESGNSAGSTDAAPLAFDTQTGAITATATAAVTAHAVSRASSGYVNVNYGGIASWANNNAYNSNNNGYPEDCTDFVSRAMYYGGGMHMIFPSGVLPHIDSNSHDWYHAGNSLAPRYSKSWSLATDGLKFVLGQGSAVSHSRSGMGVGDVVFVNWSGDSSGRSVDHAGVIVRITSKNVYIAQHDGNQIDTLENVNGSTVHSWHGKNPHEYLWVTRPVESK
jgi:hypothetical protein